MNKLLIQDYEDIYEKFPIDCKYKASYPFLYLYMAQLELYQDDDKIKIGESMLKIIKNTSNVEDD